MQRSEEGARARLPVRTTEGAAMSTPHHDDPNEPVPMMQQLLDSPFILLFLGVLIPMVVYNLWGVVEILLLPVTK
jgi:hypothetical protein